MKRFSRLVPICASLVMGITTQLSATMLAITSPATSTTATGGDFTIGYRFTVGSQDLIVSSLGIWDRNQDGLEVGGAGARQVAIWTAGGTLVTGASVTVPSGTLSDQFISGFRFEDLASPITLLANTDYVIGFNCNGIGIHNSSFTTSEGPTFNTSYLSLYDVPSGMIPSGQRGRRINGGGFSFPNSVAGGGTAWEANFLFTVPEPHSCVLVCIGSLLGMRMRSSRRDFA